MIPVFNESGSLREFAKELKIATEGIVAEFIFVDDGSTDDSASVIESLDLENLRFIALLSNSGHMAALDAGFRRASGDFIICLDSDLQHPPSLIPKMIEKAVAENLDVVYAVRSQRKEDVFLKRLASRSYYKLLRSISGVALRDSAADFRLVSKQALLILNSYPAGSSVFRTLIPSLRLPEGQLDYVASERFSGESKYTVSKMFGLAATSLITTTTRPLGLSLTAAIVSGFLAVFGFLYVLLQWIERNTIAGWASTLSVMLLMFSVLFFNVGILSLYVGRVLQQTSGKPFYVIKETWERK